MHGSPDRAALDAHTPPDEEYTSDFARKMSLIVPGDAIEWTGSGVNNQQANVDC
jgi:hypothetical protein